MVNAWSLAWEALNGTMDEEYPIIDTSVGAGNTATDFEIDDLDYEIDYYNDSADCMADIDDMYFHHLTNANSDTTTHGNSAISETCFTFIRLGDT